MRDTVYQQGSDWSCYLIVGRIAKAATSVAAHRADLDRAYVLCLPALRPFGDRELHGLALLQAAEAARLNGREMHENVFAVLTADKAVALGVVEPLNCSLFHTGCTFVPL